MTQERERSCPQQLEIQSNHAGQTRQRQMIAESMQSRLRSDRLLWLPMNIRIDHLRPNSPGGGWLDC